MLSSVIQCSSATRTENWLHASLRYIQSSHSHEIAEYLFNLPLQSVYWLSIGGLIFHSSNLTNTHGQYYTQMMNMQSTVSTNHSTKTEWLTITASI